MNNQQWQDAWTYYALPVIWCSTLLMAIIFIVFSTPHHVNTLQEFEGVNRDEVVGRWDGGVSTSAGMVGGRHGTQGIDGLQD